MQDPLIGLTADVYVKLYKLNILYLFRQMRTEKTKTIT